MRGFQHSVTRRNATYRFVPQCHSHWLNVIAVLIGGVRLRRCGKNRSRFYLLAGAPVVLVVQRFGVGLVIERSQVRLPAAALSSQLSLPSLRGR